MASTALATLSAHPPVTAPRLLGHGTHGPRQTHVTLIVQLLEQKEQQTGICRGKGAVSIGILTQPLHACWARKVYVLWPVDCQWASHGSVLWPWPCECRAVAS